MEIDKKRSVDALKETGSWPPGPPEGEKVKKSPGGGKGDTEIVRPGRSDASDLGDFDLEKYLNSNNIKFILENKNGADMFALDVCLFNPDHIREASIWRTGGGGLRYQCFHASCKGKTWRDARAVISGGKSLAEYMTGYDPDFKTAARGDKKKQDHPVSTFEVMNDEDLQGFDLPPPSEIDWTEFFSQGKFIPQYLARYLRKVLDPIKYDGANFWKYDRDPENLGLWTNMHRESINKVSQEALGYKASPAKLKNALELLGTESFIEPENFKHNPEFLNLENCMYKISNGEILPHAPEYLSRIQLPIKYNEEAECPKWDQALEEILQGNDPKIEALRSYYGYCLLPHCRFQRCLFMVGKGSNGKSVLTEILIDILGMNNVSTLPLDQFNQRFLISQLNNKLANIAGEISTDRVIDTATFKAAVSGDPILGDNKHSEPYQFYPIAKLIFSMNSIPKVMDKSHGFQRRPIVLTFDRIFEGSEVNPRLVEELKEEREGIFLWMLNGLRNIVAQNGLYIPDEVVMDSQKFVDATNPIALYLEENCLKSVDLMVARNEVHLNYVAWCGMAAHKEMGRSNFYAHMRMNVRGVREKKVNGVWVFLGMALKTPMQKQLEG